MYLGIDLGTSNSVIVGNDGGKLQLFRTPESTDFLPSVIMIDRRGHMLVGKRAYDQAAYSPENVAQGFKRLMGTSSPITFGTSNLAMTPEQASGEILKSLLAQAHVIAGDFSLEGTVITIPAAFNQMQSEATMKAALAAGIGRVGLLQEPVAAAMASIAVSPNKDGQFLIYDLGGGTFDIAIVQSVGGSVNVAAHDGINMLGGRDFDRAILNSLVRPWLVENFDLPVDFQKEIMFQRVFRVAQHRTEIAKIALSSQTSDRIFADENQIGVKDLKGKEIYLDVPVTRTEIEKLVVDQIDRSIELCRKLLQQNSYQPGDIDRVVLIGGPSRMPIVRTRISEQLGIATDSNIDPMTAVAFGAAIFAESRDWAGVSSTSKPIRGSNEVRGNVDIKYDYPARTSDNKFRVRARPGKNIEGKGYRIQIDTAQGWTSGKIDVSSDIHINDVPATQRGENRYRISVFDPKGVPVSEASTELTVFRTQASAAGIPATQTVSVKVVEGTLGSERNVLTPLVPKGTILPSKGTERFRAARDVRAGDGSHLDFELYQQAEGVNDPVLNLNVGAFRIDSKNLESGDIIRKGDEIIAHWSMDDNGLLDCALELPKIGRRYDIGKMYVATAGHRNFEGDEGFKLASAILDDAERELQGLSKALGNSAQKEIHDLTVRIGQQRQTLKQAWEADARRAVAEEARLIRQEIFKIGHRAENLTASLLADLENWKEFYDGVVREEAQPKQNAQIDRLTDHAVDAAKRATPESILDAKRSIDQAAAVARDDLMKRPSFIVSGFRYLAERRPFATEKTLHDQYVKEGEIAIAQNDIDALRAVNFKLSSNMFDVGGGAQATMLAGITRW